MVLVGRRGLNDMIVIAGRRAARWPILVCGLSCGRAAAEAKHALTSRHVVLYSFHMRGCLGFDAYALSSDHGSESSNVSVRVGMGTNTFL